LKTRLYFHSPFSEDNVCSLRDRSLLLSFALSEIFTCAGEHVQNWTLHLPSSKERSEDAPLNKLQEHSTLLLKAFPDHKESLFQLKEEVSHLIYFLRNKIPFSQKELLEKLYIPLEPLVKECIEDKDFLFFLLTHHEKMACFLEPSYLPTLFKEIYPEGLSKLQVVLCDYFHKKGFTRLLPEITVLLQQLTKKEFIHESSPY